MLMTSLLAVAFTGQIISQSTPHQGDLVALVGSEVKVSGWSNLRFIISSVDIAYPNGTLALWVSRFASVRGDYFDTVVIGTKQAFTCNRVYVWRIDDLDRAKTVFRESIGVFTEAKTKERFGDHHQAKSAFKREFTKKTAEIMRLHNLTAEQLNTIVMIGVANHWDVSDVVADAKRSTFKDAPTRASSLLAIARNLEKSDKPRAALETYRKLVSEFPDSLEAKTAKERITAIEGAQ
jgi:hypothetical protein